MSGALGQRSVRRLVSEDPNWESSHLSRGRVSVLQQALPFIIMEIIEKTLKIRVISAIERKTQTATQLRKSMGCAYGHLNNVVKKLELDGALESEKIGTSKYYTLTNRGKKLYILLKLIDEL